jgi:hypothetical protein
MEWITCDMTWREFYDLSLNLPYTEIVLENERKLLLGDINGNGGLCDDCMDDDLRNDVKIIKYRHLSGSILSHLHEAARDLLMAHEPELTGPYFLEWLANRLVDVYREDPNVDFVLCLRRRAKKARAAIEKAGFTQ